MFIGFFVFLYAVGLLLTISLIFDAIKEGDKPELVVALILLFVFLFFGFSLI
jgi:hypothetical protein